MTPDPKPYDFAWLRPRAQCAIISADSDRIDVLVWRDQLEVKRGMSRVLTKTPVGLPRRLFPALGQRAIREPEFSASLGSQSFSTSRSSVRPKRCSSSALSAN